MKIMFDDKKIIEYVVMNPSGNITILVMSDVEDEEEYYFVAKKLLELEPAAEQVGFLQYDDESDIILSMAGGEFCGNATMSAAVYYGILHGLSDGNVVVKSSGADELVNVHVKKFNDWEGTVEMPKPLEISEVDFGNDEKFPVVFFKGIAHVIIDNSCGARIVRPYDGARIALACRQTGRPYDGDRPDDEFTKINIEEKIKEWCEFLEVPAIGIMLCDNIGDIKRSQNFDIAEVNMTPLVYVKSIDTLYWESSCASGTTAIGAYIANVMNSNGKINVRQPSGTILSIDKTVDGKLLLTGKVKLLYKKSVMI